MIVVVGAVSIDLVAVREKFLDGTSNPSDIRMGLGGVGWRVFSSLDAPKLFITALARDPISLYARKAMREAGPVAVQEIADGEARPPLYLALMEAGSLKVGASDFRIVERGLDLAFVRRRIGNLSASDFLVLDANLSPSLLAALVREYAGRARVVFEPVSIEKAARHAAALRGIFLMTPTGEELRAIAPGGEEAILAFMEERKIANVLATRGRSGTSFYCAAGSGPAGGPAGREDFPPGLIVDAGDTTGAGDLLLAHLLSCLHRGTPMRAAVREAMSAVETCLREGAP
jgi:sugar/nucleoside kinase (ribokinase family)